MSERAVRPDEAYLYEGDSTQDAPAKENFADVMMEIKSLGQKGRPFTWQQMATFTGLKRSTLKSITRGELSAPRSVVFLENLRRIPGVTEEHVQRLINAADAPNSLAVISNHLREGEESEHRIESIGENGVNILLGVRLDSSSYSKKDLDVLTGHIRKQVESSVQLFKSLKEIYHKADLG